MSLSESTSSADECYGLNPHRTPPQSPELPRRCPGAPLKRSNAVLQLRSNQEFFWSVQGQLFCRGTPVLGRLAPIRLDVSVHNNGRRAKRVVKMPIRLTDYVVKL